MSLEIIEKINSDEALAKSRIDEARKQAAASVDKAKADGEELLRSASLQAAEYEAELMSETESKAKKAAAEIEKDARAAAEKIKAAAMGRTDRAADVIIERISE